MLKRTVKISLCLLLHVSVQLDHPQGSYAVLCPTQHGTQYTHHSLKYFLPQRRMSYNDVFLLTNFTIRVL